MPISCRSALRLERELPVSESTSSGGPRERYYFLLRRLHSLSGLIPIGAYLFVHLSVNATVMAGAKSYQEQVDRIHSLGAFLRPVEILFIFLPILFHAILGVVIVVQAKPNATHYNYGANWRYALQRWTGLIAFVFIGYHVWQTHGFFSGLGGGKFDEHAAMPSIASIIQSAPWVAPLYAIGMLSAVYHFANGIWTSLITWGITIGPNAQRKSGYACTALGVLLAVLGLGSLRTLRSTEVSMHHEPTPIRADAAQQTDAAAAQQDEGM